MRKQRRLWTIFAAVAFVGVTLAIPLAIAQPIRITEPVVMNDTKVLAGNRSPKARAEDDQGPLDPFDRISGITLIFQPSVSQASALDELLQQLQNPSSSNYHAWLTPEQYADRFGLNDADRKQVTRWLEAEGLSVDYVARSRMWMTFSGTA